MTVIRYVIRFCSASMAGQPSDLDAALLLISNNSSGLFKKKQKKKKSGPCNSSNRASEMLNITPRQGHNERHFLLISFINIMKSPSEGKGQERMGRRRSSAVSFIPWADLKIQVKKKKSQSLSLLRTASDVGVHTMTTASTSTQNGPPGVSSPVGVIFYRLVTKCAGPLEVPSGEAPSLLGGTMNPSLLPRPSW